MRPSVSVISAQHARVGVSPNASSTLAKLPHGTRDWKLVLSCLIALHNHRHARRDKRISYKTMQERAGFLFRFFDELRAHTTFENIDPRCVKPKHIQAMVERWMGRGLSTGTIHNYISYLHTFALWIDKAGLVLPVEHYVGSQSGLARRNESATRDKSWSGNGVSFEETLELVRQRCPFVAIEMEFGRLFGLRAKEMVMLRPHEAAAVVADVPGPQASSDGAVQQSPPHCLHIRHGAKGGRRRDVLIENEAQRDLLRRAQAMVRPGQSLARPGYTLKQNLQHYFDVLKAVGVTQAQLGVTGHGLRHERSADAYGALAGVPPPVRGGKEVDAQKDRLARDQVAAMLGHGRRAITNCYLGRPVVKRTAKAQCSPGAEPVASSNAGKAAPGNVVHAAGSGNE